MRFRHTFDHPVYAGGQEETDTYFFLFPHLREGPHQVGELFSLLLETFPRRDPVELAHTVIRAVLDAHATGIIHISRTGEGLQTIPRR